MPTTADKVETVTELIPLAGSAVSGVIQTVDGLIRAKKSKDAIDSFVQQDLINPYMYMPLSTEKSDQQTEAGLSQMATSVEALRAGGTRTVMGGIPKLQESNILLQNMISQDLAKQDIKRQYAIAQGEERIRAIQENREIMALQGYGQELASARQDVSTGIGNIASSALAAASMFGGGT